LTAEFGRAETSAMASAATRGLSRTRKTEEPTRERTRTALQIAVIIVPALLLRLALAPISAWPSDVHVWARFGWDLLAGYSPYDRLGFSYPPGWAELLAPLLTLLSTILPPGLWATTPPVALADLPVLHPIALFTVKLPAILADVLLGWMLLRREKWMGIVWLYNPLVIFVSSIQGQYDSLVALTCLMAYQAAADGMVFSSGLACGLGTILKFTPVYLAPTLVGRAFHRAIAERKLSVGMIPALGCLVGFAVPLLPAAPLIAGGFDTMVVARASPDLAANGGLNFYSLAKLPWLAQWPFWTQQYPVLIRALQIGLPLAMGALVAWRGQRALAAAVIGALAGTVLLQPTTQPQYIVWLLPVLLVQRGRRYVACALALCAMALAYYWALVGNLVAYVTQPLSVYFGIGWSSVETMALNRAYLAGKGVFGGGVASDTMTLIAIPTSLILAFIIITSLWQAIWCAFSPKDLSTGRLNPSGAAQKLHQGILWYTTGVAERFVRQESVTKREIRLPLLALFLACVAGYFVIAVQSRPLPVTEPARNQDLSGFSITFKPQGVQYRLPQRSQEYSWHFTLARRPRYLDNVHILNDDFTGDRVLVSPTLLYGLRGNFEAAAVAIDWHPSIADVSIKEVTKSLTSREPAVLIDPFGYWPADVSREALRDWIKAGGVFVWIGGKMGASDWGSSGPVRAAQPLNRVFWDAPLYPSAPPPFIDGEIPLPPEQNVGLTYRWPQQGPGASLVSALGGRALGWRSSVDDRVSVAVVPLGSGSVVFFGSGLTNVRKIQTEAAQDLVTILYRGLTDPGFAVESGVTNGRSEVRTFGRRLQDPEELAVVGSADRWVNAYANARP
jgi:hypothetical protein